MVLPRMELDLSCFEDRLPQRASRSLVTSASLGKSNHHGLWYFTEAPNSPPSISAIPFHFIDQSQGWPGPKVVINIPFIPAVDGRRRCRGASAEDSP